MYKIIKEIFTWWHNQTLGTRLFTFFWGRFVGRDELGNRYYATCDDRRRWVVYHGLVEPTRVPVLWHAWLHHISDEVPNECGTKAQKGVPRLPNLTGTAYAYHPVGSLHGKGGIKASQPSSSYTAWKPDNTSDKRGKT